ncbi:MAG: cobaltochelatase subunit CobT, partial [Pseudomonadota bacterium]
MAETDPAEVFKNALSTTTRALAGDEEVEIAYSSDGGRLSGKRIVLQPPPRKTPPDVVARVRGEADALALKIAYHDP